MILEVQAKARGHLEEIFDWYETRRDGLGSEFLDTVGVTFEKIVRHPRAHPELRETVRRARLSRFPYSVFYRLRGERIEILAVLHDARDPKRWP